MLIESAANSGGIADDLFFDNVVSPPQGVMLGLHGKVQGVSVLLRYMREISISGN